MWLPDSVNKYGTPVSVLRCESCGDTVTICPVITDREAFGDGCLADHCPSYSLARDADIFFEQMAEAGLIYREETRC